jgi:hypothetical protein
VTTNREALEISTAKARVESDADRRFDLAASRARAPAWVCDECRRVDDLSLVDALTASLAGGRRVRRCPAPACNGAQWLRVDRRP